MLSSKQKESVNKISSYLISIRDEYQSELYSIENDMARVDMLIDEAKNSKINLEATLDTSYMVLSSTQVAKEEEYAEIDSLEELILSRKKELEDLNIKRKIILEKLLEIDEIIECVKILI